VDDSEGHEEEREGKKITHPSKLRVKRRRERGVTQGNVHGTKGFNTEWAEVGAQRM
jgi:hypothetical protein